MLLRLPYTSGVGLDWLLALCAWLPLPVVAVVARRVQGQWLAPGAMVALTWTLAAGVPLWLAPDLPVHPGAYGFVLVVVLVCVFASTVGASMHLPSVRERPVDQPIEWPRRTWQLYYACVAVGFIAPMLLYTDATTATRAGDLAELAMYTSMGRYGGDYEVPGMVRLLSAATYLAAIVAGVVTGSSAPEDRAWRRSLAWTLPLVATTVISTEKAQLLYGLVLWAGGWAAGRALSNAPAQPVRGRVVLASVVGVTALAAFFVTAQSMRMNRVSLGDIPFVLNHLRIYAVGHMPVFGHWWSHDYARVDVEGFGTRSFAGLAEIAGLGVRKAGLYEGMAGFTESNIYTALRPLLEDFGTVGALAFLFLLAFAAGLGWRLLRAGRRAGAVPVVAFTAYVVWSPITSIFVYSTIIAVVLVFAAWTSWVDAVARKATRRADACCPPPTVLGLVRDP